MRVKSLFVCAMLLVPTLTFAADKKSANVTIDQPVKVAGTQLAPGQYRMTWDGTGSDVNVAFLKGKTTVATAPAKLVSTSSNGEPAIETVTNPDKTVVLKAVDLSKLTIQFQSPASASGN
jgi:hypothetical protein